MKARTLTVHRLTVLVSVSALIGLRAPPESAAQAPWPTEAWAPSIPGAQGMDAAPLEALDQRIRDREYGNVDRLVIVRNGYLVMTRRYENDYPRIAREYWAGREAPDTLSRPFNYQHPSHHPWYMGQDLHTLQSVTKSVTSALIGIAIRDGAIDSTDALMLSFFPEYDVSDADPRLATVTLEDVLTMRTGIEWHEQDRPIGPTNTTIQLEESDDWFRFTLDQPMDAEPGARWVYNSGGSHLLSGIVKSATGKYVTEYAEAELFGPLGIEVYHWKLTPRGYPDTEGGLYLEAEDLAKIGYLYLNDGVWDGARILPEGWVGVSTSRIVDDIAPVNPNNNTGYGYQWWRIDPDGIEVWAGFGYGGQTLLVIPEYDIIGVANSWNVFGPARSVIRPFAQALIASVR